MAHIYNSDRLAIKLSKLNLECSICLETLSDPRLLPCQHTYCSKCISEYVRYQIQIEKRPSADCPQCKRPVPTTNTAIGQQLILPRNRLIVELLQELKTDEARKAIKRKISSAKADSSDDDIQVIDIIPAKRSKAQGHSMQFTGNLNNIRLLALKESLKITCDHFSDNYNIYCSLCDRLYCSVCTALNLPNAVHSDVDTSDVIFIEESDNNNLNNSILEIPTPNLSNEETETETMGRELPETEALLTLTHTNYNTQWSINNDPEERWRPLPLYQPPLPPFRIMPPSPFNLTDIDSHNITEQMNRRYMQAPNYPLT